jgi:hypothetical protein
MVVCKCGREFSESEQHRSCKNCRQSNRDYESRRRRTPKYRQDGAVRDRRSRDHKQFEKDPLAFIHRKMKSRSNKLRRTLNAL